MKKIMLIAIISTVMQGCFIKRNDNKTIIKGICETKMEISNVKKISETNRVEEFSFIADGKYNGVAEIPKTWYSRSYCRINME